MNDNSHPIARIHQIGQSIWLDDIHHGLLATDRIDLPEIRDWRWSTGEGTGA